MQVITFGIDLAKNVFQIHGVDAAGHTVVKKQLKRDQLAPYFANVAPATIGMEACSSAHYWARKLQGMGHSVKLMAPQFVKPYSRATKTMPTMQRRFARLSHANPCALYRSRMSSSKRC